METLCQLLHDNNKSLKEIGVVSEVTSSFAPPPLPPLCRLQPPAALVLHDLLHHPAGAPGLARHQWVQEEVRLSVGRVLPDGPLPDHPTCLLREGRGSWAQKTLLSTGLLFKPAILFLRLVFFSIFFFKKRLKMSKLIFRIIVSFFQLLRTEGATVTFKYF